MCSEHFISYCELRCNSATVTPPPHHHHHMLQCWQIISLTQDFKSNVCFFVLSRLQWLIPTYRYVAYSIHVRNYCFVILCHDVFYYYYVYYVYENLTVHLIWQQLTTTQFYPVFNPVNHLPSLRSWASDFLVRECLLTRFRARARSAFCSQYKAARDTFHPLLCGDSTRPS